MSAAAREPDVYLMLRCDSRDTFSKTGNAGSLVLVTDVVIEEPEGWLLCDGRELQVADYPTLCRVLGTGATDTTRGVFRLPDYRGLVARVAKNAEGPWVGVPNLEFAGTRTTLNADSVTTAPVSFYVKARTTAHQFQADGSLSVVVEER